MHSDTEIYATVEKLADGVLRAVAQMRREAKPVLGMKLVEETCWASLLVRRAAIARGAAKGPHYDELIETLEVVQFYLRRAFNNRYVPASRYSECAPLAVSVARQANALKAKFVPAS